MWVVKAKGCSSADAVLRWLRGEEGIRVYGTSAAAEKVAALQDAGIEVAESPADMGEAVVRAIKRAGK